MNVKLEMKNIKGFIAIFLIQLIFGMSFYSPDTFAISISKVDAISPNPNNAIITWITDKNATSAVIYNGFEKGEPGYTTNHSVKIDGLDSGQKYFYYVKSCNASDTCAVSLNSSFTAGSDSGELVSNIKIPRYVNRRVIDITGSTKPLSTVLLYVNDFSNPKKVQTASDTDGKLSFSQVVIEDQNRIKISIRDRAGNEDEKIFDVTVDATGPIVLLNNLSKLTSKANITLSGTVNEPVTVRIYSETDAAENSSGPSKITGVNTTKISKNAVEIKWTESKDKDFSHYVIYRNGVAIALARPSSFTLFTDALVDSGKTYTYEISAFSIFGTEGQKSDILSVKTQDGGQTLNLNYPEINIFEDFSKPYAEFNTSGAFSYPLKLNKDGTYKFRIAFEDLGGNKVTLERTIVLDTKRPLIKMTSPYQGAFIYENLAGGIDIIGTTEPDSKVHLFVNRFPFSTFNQSLEVSGLPNDILPQLDSIPEIDLDAKCRLNLGGNQYCGNSADKSTISDSSGNFKFENVDLTAFFGQASRINEVPLTDFSQVELNEEAKQAKSTTLLIIATDQSGLRNFAKNTIRIGNCYSGNLSWDVVPLTEFQSPTFLSPERLGEGTEALYFYYNFSYIGRGNNAQITKVSIQKACSNRGLVDSRYNTSCTLFQGATPIAVNKPDNTVWYSTAPLARTPGMERLLENDWKSFMKAINNEMTFPLLVTINYKHDITDENGIQRQVSEIQRTCDEVSYVMDNTLINPQTVLPDWMLYDFVEYLQNSVKTLTQVQQQIDRLIDYVGQACLWTYLAHTVFKIYRTWVDTSIEFQMKLPTFTPPSPECVEIINAVKAKNGGIFRLNKVSDPDIKLCFPSSYSAWGKEKNFYEWQRWSCDRIFGHSAPSKWTENKEDKEIIAKIEQQQKCQTDDSVQGQPLRANKCVNFAPSYPKARERDIDSMCVEVWVEVNKKQALYAIGPKVAGSDNVYQLELVDGYTKSIIYAVRDNQNENYFLTARPKTCDELCGGKKQTEKKVNIQVYDSKTDTSKTLFSNKPKQGVEKEGICLQTSICNNLGQAATTQQQVSIEIDGRDKLVQVKSANPRGYTSDCFYDGDEPIGVVASASSREECCCINTKGEEDIIYYQPDDITDYDGKPAHESKEGTTGPSPKSEDPNGFTDMKFSYRYQRIKFQSKGITGEFHNSYNPNRYIDGRDVYACFGQNAIFKGEETVIINPFKQHLSTFQCAYLTGVNQRLQLVTNIMTSMSNCLMEVRESGRADSGVCKELFTQQVCGAMWQAVRFFIDGCSPEGLGVNEGTTDDDVTAKLKLGFKGLAQGITESQQEISEEYGNAKLNNLLGIGEGGVARKACLAAFGYDWDLSAKNLVDAAYTAPFSTLVQPVTRSREYLTIDPITLRPKYEYRASWFINPGCDIENYKVDLVCVGQKEINENTEVNCGAVGAPSIANTGAIGTSTEFNQCDCRDLPQGQETSFFGSSQRLKQNVAEDKDVSKVIDSNYRYDHLKFTLRTDRRIPANIRQNCFPTGYEDGVFYRPIIDKTARDIADCSVNPLSGIYSCKGGVSYVGQKGIVQVQQITLNGQDTMNNQNNQQLQFQIGEPLKVGMSLTKTGKDKCLKISMTPDIMQPVFEGIIGEGQNDIPEIQISNALSISSTTGNVISKDLVYKLLTQNNDQPITFTFQATDNPAGSGTSQNVVGAYSPDDTIIIDGIQITLLSSQQEYTNGQTIVKVEQVANSVPKITVRKDNAEIEITGLTYLKDVQSNEFRNIQTVTINPPQQTTSQSQQKTILLEIFNMKDQSEVYTSSSDCNLNDRIFEKQVKFTVTQSGVDSQELAPVIENIRFSVRTPIIIGNEVVVSSRIRHKLGIQSAVITIKDLSGNVISGSDNAQMIPNSDVFSHTFQTAGLLPGKYNLDIKATSTNGKTSQKTGQVELKTQGP